MTVPTFAPVLALLGLIANIAIAGFVSGLTWFVTSESPEAAYEYNVSITPSDWVFGIWAPLYIWQLLWLLYCIKISFCHCFEKPEPRGRNESTKIVFTTTLYVTYFWVCVLNVISIILMNYFNVTASAIFVTLTTFLLYICCYTTHKYLMFDLPIFVAIGKQLPSLVINEQTLLMHQSHNHNNNNNVNNNNTSNTDDSGMYSLTYDTTTTWAETGTTAAMTTTALLSSQSIESKVSTCNANWIETTNFPSYLTSHNDSNSNNNNNNSKCCTQESMLQLLVLNGLSFYATWMTFLMCLQWSLAFRKELAKSNQLKNEYCVMISIVLLYFATFVYLFCEFVKFVTSLQKTFMPYVTFIVIYCGILYQNSIFENNSSVAILILLIIIVIALFYKFYQICKNANKMHHQFLDASFMSNSKAFLSEKEKHGNIKCNQDSEYGTIIIHT